MQKQNALKVLLKDYGYSVRDNALYSNAIRGFYPERRMHTVRDLWDACESIIPILSPEDRAQFHRRLDRIRWA